MNRLLLPTYLKHVSIRRKLMLLLMATCGLILVATTAVFVVKESASLIREQRKNLTSLADILSKNITASLTFNDPQSALETMNSLSVKSDILAAYILRPDATIFTRYIASKVQTDKLPFEQLGAAPSADSCRSVLEQLKLNSNRFLQLNDQVSLVTPIRLDGQEIGTVVLFADMRELRARLLGTLLASALILLFAALGAYLLSIRLQGIISEPIMHLSDTMRMVSENKDFSLRVTKTGNDEIGTLYDGFNEMLQEIEERDLVLCQRQEHLQQLAHFDTLTRLPNRVLFHDRLLQAMNLALRTDQVIAVMFLDLDRFKDINDTLGHRIGAQQQAQGAPVRVVRRGLGVQLQVRGAVERLHVRLAADPGLVQHGRAAGRRDLDLPVALGGSPRRQPGGSGEGPGRAIDPPGAAVSVDDQRLRSGRLE
ncbi:MAG: diguanylate cyclase [Geobacter sp.]|nr:diguanylate cyclase [Geobacter sp.]